MRGGSQTWSIVVAYGENPSNSTEARFNKKVAEEVAQILSEGASGETAKALPVRSDWKEPLGGAAVFNLCDGDPQEGRFSMVDFAEELEKSALPHTGCTSQAIRLCFDKTLKWVETARTPKYWLAPPAQPYLAKPKRSHGSMMISSENINHEGLGDDFFYQALLTGTEYTACFVGTSLIGFCAVYPPGAILGREDKWPSSGSKSYKCGEWMHEGIDDTAEVASEAGIAWLEMLRKTMPPTMFSQAYGRVDVRKDSEGRPFVIDINPNAYLGSDGMLAACWCSRGQDYRSLIWRLAEGIIDRKPAT